MAEFCSAPAFPWGPHFAPIPHPGAAQASAWRELMDAWDVVSGASSALRPGLHRHFKCNSDGGHLSSMPEFQMPTVFAHALVPIAIGLGLGRRRIPPRLLMAGAAAAMLPDADVVAFKFGIAYADALGHRGASHSVVFALLLGVLAASVACAGLDGVPVRRLLGALASTAGHADQRRPGRGAVVAVVGAAFLRAVAGHRGIAVRAPVLQRARRGGIVVGSPLDWHAGAVADGDLSCTTLLVGATSVAMKASGSSRSRLTSLPQGG